MKPRIDKAFQLLFPFEQGSRLNADMNWQAAPEESVAQMEEKSPQAEEIAEIEKKICGEHPSFLQRGEKSVRTGETSVFTYR
ncbi:hypothetical protein [Trichormus variabilis]|uniref:Uncharacterized protein n=2 Tax=Anabaena TaxID=1163 RepID=A0ABR8FEX6_9NOST|nr:hypothetical protein [Trichormus variabilis]MBD2568790.1 hypothetical protein [Anabaena lutea FACHB-196]MBD2629000.1 hypothetical protein [Trichormus variabilis FACHB-164]